MIETFKKRHGEVETRHGRPFRQLKQDTVDNFDTVDNLRPERQ